MTRPELAGFQPLAPGFVNGGMREKCLNPAPRAADNLAMSFAHTVKDHLLHHLAPRTARAATQGAPSSRLQVCPPEAWPPAPGLAQRMWRRLGAGCGLRSLTRRQIDTLAAARQDHLDAIGDLYTHAADELRLRIGRARSLRELWHLRSPLFMLLARALGEAQAEQRLARLTRFFPTRSPRSGFGALSENA